MVSNDVAYTIDSGKGGFWLIPTEKYRRYDIRLSKEDEILLLKIYTEIIRGKIGVVKDD